LIRSKEKAHRAEELGERLIAIPSEGKARGREKGRFSEIGPYGRSYQKVKKSRRLSQEQKTGKRATEKRHVNNLRSSTTAPVLVLEREKIRGIDGVRHLTRGGKGGKRSRVQIKEGPGASTYHMCKSRPFVDGGSVGSRKHSER